MKFREKIGQRNIIEKGIKQRKNNKNIIVIISKGIIIKLILFLLIQKK